MAGKVLRGARRKGLRVARRRGSDAAKSSEE
jgi:hypothetical protein